MLKLIHQILRCGIELMLMLRLFRKCSSKVSFRFTLCAKSLLWRWIKLHSYTNKSHIWETLNLLVWATISTKTKIYINIYINVWRDPTLELKICFINKSLGSALQMRIGGCPDERTQFHLFGLTNFIALRLHPGGRKTWVNTESSRHYEVFWQT